MNDTPKQPSSNAPIEAEFEDVPRGQATAPAPEPDPDPSPAPAAAVAPPPEPETEEKGGAGALVYLWLLLLTVGVGYMIYTVILQPEALRDRMALAEAPAIKAGIETGAAAGRTAEANAAAVQAVEAAQAETAEKIDAVAAKADQALATVNEAIAAGDQAVTARLDGVIADLEQLKAGAEATDGVAPVAGAALKAGEAAQAAADANAARLEALNADLTAALESATSALAAAEARIAALEERASKADSRSLVEAVVALGDLRKAVADGKPFAPLLDRARAALPDATELTEGAWVGFADSGLPDMAALTAEMQKISLAIGQDSLKDKLSSGEGWLDRAVGGVVERLRVRRVGADVEGDDPAAVAARAEAALNDGDLAQAIEEVSALEGPAAERFAGWLARAKAVDTAAADIDAVEKAAIAAADGA